MSLSDPFHKDLPKLPMTLRELQSLPEYSCSVPTGQTIGKRWRIHSGVYDRKFMEAGGIPTWIVAEYVECDKPGMIGINYYRPLIRAKALTA